MLNIGGAIISKLIELIPGSYKLTDFMLVDASDEVLFATPRKGSPMAMYVKNSLDVSSTAGGDLIL